MSLEKLGTRHRTRSATLLESVVGQIRVGFVLRHHKSFDSELLFRWNAVIRRVQKYSRQIVVIQIHDLQREQHYSVLIIEQVGHFRELPADENICQRSDIDLPVTTLGIFSAFEVFVNKENENINITNT